MIAIEIIVVFVAVLVAARSRPPARHVSPRVMSALAGVAILAFGLAMADTLLDGAQAFGPAADPLALIIAPTRELANWVATLSYDDLPQRTRDVTRIALLDTLGAGFQLASHDLDIRGAGNLLGDEQSGHIKEVGFELYQQMLEEAVTEARESGADRMAAPSEEQWSPHIEVGIPVLIPSDYVPDLGIRLGLYRRVAQLTRQDEIDAFAAEMIDRFGALPPEVEQLMKLVSIKMLCVRAHVEKIEAGPKGVVVLGFPSNDFGEQEPGTGQEIADFCRLTYDVTFPMFSKVVTQPGRDQSPVYRFLGTSGHLPAWNFAKYLVNKHGKVVGFYPSEVTPESPVLRAAIAKALAEVP